MSDSLEQAAMAFDESIGGNANAPAREPASKRPTETMFGDVGTLEVDETSPLEGGGDHEDDEEAPVRRKPVAKFEDDEHVDGDEESDDGQPDDDADEEDGKDDEDVDEDEVYEVTVDGERVEVPLREALQGYIRQQTFHRRLNQLNEVGQTVSARAKEVDDMRTEYTGLIDKMKKGIEALVPANMDWDALYAQDPKQARELENKYNNFKELMSSLDKEKTNEQKKRDQELAESRRNDVAVENERIMRNNPSWRDPKTMQRDQELMLKTATSAGYSVEEVAGITDSRQVSILLKAAKWDRLQGDRPKPVRKGVKPGQKGAGPGNKSRTAPRAEKGAMKQLARTGSVEDAAAVFSGLITNKTRR